MILDSLVEINYKKKMTVKLISSWIFWLHMKEFSCKIVFALNFLDSSRATNSDKH